MKKAAARKKPLKLKAVVPPPPPYKGRNVRFTESSYIDLKAFCDERGYRISGFCQRAAVEAMEAERKNLNQTI